MLKYIFAELVALIVNIFNLLLNLFPSLLKKVFLKALLKKIYFNSYLDYNLYIRNPFKLSLGKNVSINYGCSFYTSLRSKIGKIIINDNVTLSPNVKIYAISQNYKSVNFDELAKDVIINKYAWICANCVILPGVNIGENSVIAAGSVVNKSIPSNEVWGGVPAKFIKLNNKNDRI
jgi:acetyltransferase-like isoleucine patch superfamily enzyme